MIVPPYLQKGDAVALVAVSGKINPSQIKNTFQVLENWGLEPVEGKSLKNTHYEFAGTDTQRVTDINSAIENPTIKAIICFRGGYGAVRILEQINYEALQQDPKWICGYSDVTALHNALANTNIASVHSAMPVNFQTATSEALLSLKNALMGDENNYVFSSSPENTTGHVQAPIIGGNLSLLCSLIGTPYDINTNGKILFIEEIDEYLYHIDRIMWHLKLAEKLSCITGLIVGGMTGIKDNESPFGKSVIEIIQEAVREYNFPVCFNFPAGHIDDNRSIIFGKEAILIITSEKVVFQQ